MTILLLCLFIATLMPIMAKAPLAYAMNQLEGGYDNRHPRSQHEKLTGFGARSKAAHDNCFEALIMFTPGALACIATNTVGTSIEYLAIGFIFARSIYVLAYLSDVHLVRSTAWLAGFVISLALLYLAIP